MTATIIAVVATFVAAFSIIGWVLEHLAHTETKRRQHDKSRGGK